MSYNYKRTRKPADVVHNIGSNAIPDVTNEPLCRRIYTVTRENSVVSVRLGLCHLVALNNVSVVTEKCEK